MKQGHDALLHRGEGASGREALLLPQSIPGLERSDLVERLDELFGGIGQLREPAHQLGPHQSNVVPVLPLQECRPPALKIRRAPVGRDALEDLGPSRDERACAILEAPVRRNVVQERTHLEALSPRSPDLRNVYSVLRVNPERFPGRIEAAGAERFERFLTTHETQRRIGEFGRERYGRALFEPLLLDPDPISP